MLMLDGDYWHYIQNKAYICLENLKDKPVAYSIKVEQTLEEKYLPPNVSLMKS